MLHSLLKPKWKTKLFFFYYKHIFLYGAVVSLYYPKLCPCLIMVILFTLMPLSLSQNTVYQQRWYLTAALSCVWLFVCFFVVFLRDCQMLINTKKYFWITYSFAGALIPQCHL